MNNNIDLYCAKCDFRAPRVCEFIRHCKSSKHQRNGEKKPIICNICNKQVSSHFILKSHILINHSSIDDKKKHKYYCETCDTIVTTQHKLDIHNETKVHKNKILAIELLKDCNIPNNCI